MQPATTETQTTGTVTWDIDPTHSGAEFKVKHLMIATVKGALPVTSGTIVQDLDDPTRTTIEAVLDATGIDTRTADRDAHLRSADFLDVENHPTIKFVSTAVEQVDGETFRVTGDLTIRGVTKPVTLDVEFEGRAVDPWGNTRAVASATTTIDRREWGLTWNQALETGGILVGDNVKVALNVQGVRRQ